VRSLLVTLLGVLLIGGAVTTSAWALQAALLPPPERGDISALKAVAGLEHYRFVESSVHVDGAAPVRGRCLTGWFPERGELLQLGRGTSIVDLGRHDLRIGGPVRGDPVASLLLAGCPRVLGREVERLLQAGASTSSARVWFGRPAVAVRIREPRGAAITLYLTPEHSVLLGVRIRSRRLTGLSHVYALALTPARLQLIEGRR
jgi:hypothetical protein